MRPSYPESSVFLVPLKDGGFARGVVTRTAPGGKLLVGYFFGPRLTLQSKAVVSQLEASDAVLSLRFGDLGLFKGLWPIVGKLPSWDPAKWPMPDAVRRDPLGRIKPILIRYDDHDPSKISSEVLLEHDNGLPAEGLAGYGYVEAKLTKLLSDL
jgi:hypothetical protein